MRLTLLVASTATAMITAAWKAWVAMATAAPTVAALVFLWTIPPTLMTSDTQPGDATLLTAGGGGLLYPPVPIFSGAASQTLQCGGQISSHDRSALVYIPTYTSSPEPASL